MNVPVIIEMAGYALFASGLVGIILAIIDTVVDAFFGGDDA